MRVLVLDQFSDPGGAQQVLLDVLTAFRGRGWDALVAAPGSGPLLDRASELGFKIHSLGCARYRNGAKPAREWLRFARELPALAGEIRRCADGFVPDLLYINGPRLLPAAALAGVRGPVLFHCHSYVPTPVRWACGIALRRLRSAIVGVCRFVCDQWKPFVPEHRMTVIYNGVAGPASAGARIPGPPQIACIGRIAPEKGQMAFVEAARIVHRTMPECRFRIIGAPLFHDAAARRYEEQVRSAARGLPIEFTGWTNDVYAAMRDVDILLAPSLVAEATPRVIPEAWAAGVPVIIFPAGGIAEIVQDGHNGLLASSPAEMAGMALHLLTTGRTQAARIAAEGRKTWTEKFQLEIAREQWLQAVMRLTSGECATNARRSQPGEALL